MFISYYTINTGAEKNCLKKKKKKKLFKLKKKKKLFKFLRILLVGDTIVTNNF